MPWTTNSIYTKSSSGGGFEGSELIYSISRYDWQRGRREVKEGKKRYSRSKSVRKKKKRSPILNNSIPSYLVEVLPFLMYLVF